MSVIFVSVINLSDNDVIYIDEEAIVFGAINAIGAKKVPFSVPNKKHFDINYNTLNANL